MLSRARLSRDEALRADPAALAEGWRSAKVLRVNRQGRLAGQDGALVFRPALEFGDAPPEEGAVFLCEEEGAHIWAVQVAEVEGKPFDLRWAGQTLSAFEAVLASTTVAMLDWQGRSKFASWSGEPMVLAKGGWVRVAPDGREEFPRTDPAVICLVHDGADQVLLARQPSWPQRWFSVLAGFCEPGESLEQCVEREVAEEVGAAVREIRYLGSQPWPFPRSLVLGFEAAADPAQPLVLADGEIVQARWFHLDEVSAALALRGDGATGQSPASWGEGDSQAPLLLPGTVSIARATIESWAGGRLAAQRP